jgi:hypothetical protein
MEKLGAVGIDMGPFLNCPACHEARLPVGEVDDEYVQELEAGGHNTVPLHSCYVDAAFSFQHLEGAGSTLNKVRHDVVQKRIALDTDRLAPASTCFNDEAEAAPMPTADTCSAPPSPSGFQGPEYAPANTVSSPAPAANASVNKRLGLRDIPTLKDFNNHPGANDTTTSKILCNDFTAGEGNAKAGKYDISGLMGVFCRHGIPGPCCNVHGGERYIYAKFLLFFLVVMMETTTSFVFYDVGKLTWFLVLV